ncbi:CvpA family protein [Campylobacter novaezeelandiae]|uniref:CvpA family protein n=1 Tax=Campylobacter novaezeelandiae TaxID=2267891 RepID=A0A4Q9JTV9_9BACT|nr:CvpA family protein [Campylobacter novaezeelandiae]MBK1963716.1 CvpA family protein [Campylobacter novaezeelandiae]MBK1993535.1 CvpA family protein [Campylobacter novaezeelandiae]TBR79433.1 CvpA family protein [Campylobacter novaezeelandiae]TBR80567.1 CvpA family protein [Campylobacter novaezeelandiae]TBR80748.1 CvpA family protein [Campylobacter novaezeelandiae]
MNFYWFDIFILGFTLLLGLKGILNGLFKEVFGLVGIVGGIFIASKYSAEATKLIQNTFYKIENESLASFAGFMVILVLFWVFCLILGSFLSKLIKWSGLGFVDRIGGFLFGAAKIFLIFSIFVFCISKISFLNDKLNNFAQNSYTLDLLKNVGSYIMNQPLTEASIDKMNKNLEEFDSNNALKEKFNAS